MTLRELLDELLKEGLKQDILDRESVAYNDEDWLVSVDRIILIEDRDRVIINIKNKVM